MVHRASHGDAAQGRPIREHGLQWIEDSVMNRKLYVGNLPFSDRGEHLEAMFAEAGPVSRCA